MFLFILFKVTGKVEETLICLVVIKRMILKGHQLDIHLKLLLGNEIR